MRMWGNHACPKKREQNDLSVERTQTRKSEDNLGLAVLAFYTLLEKASLFNVALTYSQTPGATAFGDFSASVSHIMADIWGYRYRCRPLGPIL